MAVGSYADIERLLVQGSKARTVAATNMNMSSSRSHAVFTLTFTQSTQSASTKSKGSSMSSFLRGGSATTTDRSSKISMIDLAGSERASVHVEGAGGVGDRMRETANINRSLSTLGDVIKALAERTTSTSKDEHFVPYRNSALTWLLKESLGGNSKTTMVAAISPSAGDYSESLSTLQYIARAKRIVNTAMVNEDCKEVIIRQLREEIEELKKQVVVGGGGGEDAEGAAASALLKEEVSRLRSELARREKLFGQMTMSWEEKLEEAKRAEADRLTRLSAMGITAHASLRQPAQRARCSATQTSATL